MFAVVVIQEIQSQQAVILCNPELQQPQTLLKLIKDLGISYSRVVTMNSLEVVAHLTATGSGIGILPRRVAEAVAPGQLRQVEGMPICADEVCLIYRHENRNVQAIQTIANKIKDSSAIN